MYVLDITTKDGRAVQYRFQGKLAAILARNAALRAGATVEAYRA